MNKNDIKNIEEKEVLDHFLGTEIGKNWYRENSIVGILSSESPDFLFKTVDNINIGLEITKFFVEHKNRLYSQILTRIGNQLCTELQKKHNIYISILLLNLVSTMLFKILFSGNSSSGSFDKISLTIA